MGVGLMHHLLADSRHQARAASSPTVACHVCLLSSFLYSEKKKGREKLTRGPFLRSHSQQKEK
jgi:hypothetical protein